MEIEAGQTYEVTYPFVQEEFESIFEQGTKKEWRPGVRKPDVNPFFSESADYGLSADGEGKMILTVIDTFKPRGKYQKRVFYTRKWQRPDGSHSGNNRLKTSTLAAFKRKVGGYPHHYDIDTGA